MSLFRRDPIKLAVRKHLTTDLRAPRDAFRFKRLKETRKVPATPEQQDLGYDPPEAPYRDWQDTYADAVCVPRFGEL